MRIFCMLFMGCLSFPAIAKSSQDCKELKSEQIRLALTASNLANINSTRTPEGGPYHPYIIKSCTNGGCELSRDLNIPIMKYLPDHPDADINGYVAFPNINERAEYATFNMTATKLKLLASAKVCDSKVLFDNGSSSFALRYSHKGDSDVKEDIFNFTKNHQAISWMRQDSRGRTTTVNFTSNGQISSHSQSE